MSSTLELLDRYKKAQGITSDNAAAIALNTGRATTSNWRRGNNHPSAAMVQKMCDGAGESVAKWLPLIEAERAATAADRKVWLRLAATAASFAVLVLTRMSIM